MWLTFTGSTAQLFMLPRFELSHTQLCYESQLLRNSWLSLSRDRPRWTAQAQFRVNNLHTGKREKSPRDTVSSPHCACACTNQNYGYSKDSTRAKLWHRTQNALQSKKKKEKPRYLTALEAIRIRVVPFNREHWNLQKRAGEISAWASGYP